MWSNLCLKELREIFREGKGGWVFEDEYILFLSRIFES